MVSSIDLILLGMVYDQPRSAYDIQKHVEYRNLSHWVKISSPSVYKKLRVLEQKGLECVQRIAQSLQDTRTYLSMQRDVKKEIPYVGRSILEQQLSVCETLLTWCHTLCEELKSSDGLEKMKELP